jgi:hypothetical protein
VGHISFLFRHLKNFVHATKMNSFVTKPIFSVLQPPACTSLSFFATEGMGPKVTLLEDTVEQEWTGITLVQELSKTH